MRAAAMRAVLVFGVPFMIAIALVVRILHRRSPWHPVRTVGRSVGEGRARYGDFVRALDEQQRRAERSMLSNLFEDSLPVLLGWNATRPSSSDSRAAAQR